MRGIDASIFSFSRNSPEAAVPESTVTIPPLGAMVGFNLRLTEDAPDAGGTIVATRISAMVASFVIRNAAGEVLCNLTGRQLERYANEASIVGESVVAGAPGDGTAVIYERFIPISIAREEMPAYVDLTWAPTSALYSVAPTAGYTALTASMRGLYTQEPIRTTRIKAFTPAAVAGNNSLGQLLPVGEEIDRLFVLPNDAGSNPLVDDDVTDLTLTVNGFQMLAAATIPGKFKPEDVEFRRDGHTDGVINTRLPIFVVNNAVLMTLNLGTLADYDIVTMSRKPQQRT